MRIVTIKDIDAPTCFFFKLRKARNHKQIQQLSCGRSPGVGRLPSEFYKKLWALIGQVLFVVLKQCLDLRTLPVCCTRPVLTLLTVKGDLGLLKKWRPVSLLCIDIKYLLNVSQID